MTTTELKWEQSCHKTAPTYTLGQGGKTPGVDKIIWKTPQQKMKAAQSLTRKGYQTQPLRRIYIPKKDGRLSALNSNDEMPGNASPTSAGSGTNR